MATRLLGSTKNQGVYGDQGELKPAEQKVNKTCDSAKRRSNRASLSIAFRALSKARVGPAHSSLLRPVEARRRQAVGARAIVIVRVDGSIWRKTVKRFPCQIGRSAKKDGQFQISGWKQSRARLQ